MPYEVLFGWSLLCAVTALSIAFTIWGRNGL